MLALAVALELGSREYMLKRQSHSLYCAPPCLESLTLPTISRSLVAGKDEPVFGASSAATLLKVVRGCSL